MKIIQFENDDNGARPSLKICKWVDWISIADIEDNDAVLIPVKDLERFIEALRTVEVEDLDEG